MKIKKSLLLSKREINSMAGVTGIEPALAVLETVVLPLYDTPVAR